MSDRFRTIACALRGHITDSYSLLEATDYVIAADPYPASSPPEFPHDLLVAAALGTPLFLQHIAESHKIYAIRELRALAGCSLGAAKAAVDDERVTNEVALMTLRAKLDAPTVAECQDAIDGDPWGYNPHLDDSLDS